MKEYPTQALPIGTQIISPMHSYKVEEVLGMGGFGVTYKVSTKITVGNIPVTTYFCIKEHFVVEYCSRDENERVNVSKAAKEKYDISYATFHAEAKLLNNLSGKHKGIVRVNEVFEANNTVYYVMEHLDGMSLREYVETRGCLSEAESIDIIDIVGNALSFLHSQRITHLDVKPDNIIMTSTDDGSLHPVLIDFGLSQHYDNKGLPTSINRVAGCSEGYSPMEQYVKLDAFSPTADIYALAATFIFVLTGKDPKISAEVTEQYILETIPNAITERTRNAILCAMKRDVRERIKTVETFLCQLSDQSISDVNKKRNETKLIGSTEAKELRKMHYVLAISIFMCLGYVCMTLFNNTSSQETEEDALMADVTNITDESIAIDMEESENTAETKHDDSSLAVDQHSTDADKALLEKYLQKVESLISKAESKSGDKAMIQVILDAKYYYYVKAMEVNEKVNGTRLPVNVRLTRLVKREYDYWITKGNNAGKRRSDYATKKEYYECAYKLINSDRLKSYIEWLDAHMSNRKR